MAGSPNLRTRTNLRSGCGSRSEQPGNPDGGEAEWKGRPRLRSGRTGSTVQHEDQTLFRRRPPRAGFSLLEMVIALAIMSILAALSVIAISDATAASKRRAAMASFHSMLTTARDRARARQRTQIVVVHTTLNAQQKYGFYTYEDSQVAPNLYTADQLTTIATSITPPDISAVPPAFSLRFIDAVQFETMPFYLSADAWRGTPVPFPWSGLMVSTFLSTTQGCTFCVGNIGIVGFLPNGRTIMTNNNPSSGMVVFTAAQATAPMVSAVGVNRLGFVQALEHQ